MGVCAGRGHWGAVGSHAQMRMCVCVRVCMQAFFPAAPTTLSRHQRTSFAQGLFVSGSGQPLVFMIFFTLQATRTRQTGRQAAQRLMIKKEARQQARVARTQCWCACVRAQVLTALTYSLRRRRCHRWSGPPAGRTNSTRISAHRGTAQQTDRQTERRMLQVCVVCEGEGHGCTAAVQDAPNRATRVQ